MADKYLPAAPVATAEEYLADMQSMLLDIRDDLRAIRNAVEAKP